MVPTQIGERADREDDAVHPVRVQGVRGDLHGHGLHPVVYEPGQLSLEGGRLGGGPGSVERPDHARSPAVGLQDRPHQLGHRGLPVGAGDAHHGQRSGRVTVEGRRDRGHCRPDPAGRHPDLGDAELEEVLAEERGRTAGDRLGGVGVAVGALAGHAAEQRAGADLSAVELDRADLGGRGIAPEASISTSSIRSTISTAWWSWRSGDVIGLRGSCPGPPTALPWSLQPAR